MQVQGVILSKQPEDLAKTASYLQKEVTLIKVRGPGQRPWRLGDMCLHTDYEQLHSGPVDYSDSATHCASAMLLHAMRRS